MIIFDGKLHSGTHIIIISYFATFCFIAVIGTFFLFFAPFHAEYFIQTGSILLICSLIFGIVAVFKCLIVLMHKICEAKKSTQMRNEILIGLVGIVICGIVPRILVFFVKSVENIIFLLSFTFLSFVISIALYYLFVYECDKYYESSSDASSNEYLYLFGLHVVALMVIVKFVLSCDFNTNETMGINAYQLMIGLQYAPVTFDLYGILSGQRKLKNVVEVEEPAGNNEIVRLGSARKEKAEVLSSEHETCKNQELKAAQTYPKIDCKVCRVEYSDIRIPRYLRECGHTLCESCADILLIKNQMRSLVCPFCKIATAVNGPASMLQKNYGVLEIINDLKNWKHVHDNCCV